MGWTPAKPNRQRNAITRGQVVEAALPGGRRRSNPEFKARLTRLNEQDRELLERPAK